MDEIISTKTDAGLCIHGNFIANCKECSSEYDVEKENTLTATSEGIVEKLKSAFLSPETSKKFLETPQPFDKLKILMKKLKKVWPEHDIYGLRNAFKLSAITPEFSNIELKFTMSYSRSGLVSYEGKPIAIELELKGLMDAQNEDELIAAFAALTESIYHEVEHIYYPGADNSLNELEDIKDILDYISDPGEICAYAKQFAYRYTTEFPNQPFDLEKMRSIAQNTRQGENYFVGCANPEVIQKYKAFGDIAKIHDDIVKWTQKYVEYLANRKSLSKQLSYCRDLMPLDKEAFLCYTVMLAVFTVN